MCWKAALAFKAFKPDFREGTGLELEKNITLFHGIASTQVLAGDTAAAMTTIAAAKATIDRIFDAMPSNSAAFQIAVRLLALKAKAGDPKGAEATLKTLRADSDLTDAWNGVATAYMAQKDQAAAERAFASALASATSAFQKSKYPEHEAGPATRVAIARADAGDWQGALQTMKQSNEKGDNVSRAYAAVIRTRAMSGDISGIQDMIEQSELTQRQRSYSVAGAASLLIDSGNLKAAEELLSGPTPLESAAVAKVLAVSAREGHLDVVLKHIERLSARDRLQLATVFVKAKDQAGARKVLESVAEGFLALPDSPERRGGILRTAELLIGAGAGKEALAIAGMTMPPNTTRPATSPTDAPSTNVATSAPTTYRSQTQRAFPSGDPDYQRRIASQEVAGQAAIYARAGDVEGAIRVANEANDARLRATAFVRAAAALMPPELAVDAWWLMERELTGVPEQRRRSVSMPSSTNPLAPASSQPSTRP